MNYQQLIEQAHDYVLTFYKMHDTSSLIYHNLQHTEDVVAAAIKIANHYQLSDEDFFVVMAAAWFHDLGYMVDIASHEDRGAELATEFFEKHQVNKKLIGLINSCIMATKMPQTPKSQLEEIICDSDLFHLGTDKFKEKDKLLFKEVNLLHHAGLDKLEWHRKSVKFLEAHSYFTDYCKVLLNDNKEKNLEELKRKITKEEKKLQKEDKKADKQALKFEATIVEEDQLSPPSKQEPDDKKKKDKSDKEKPEKGIETMFRVSSSNHQRLSDMADNKAHIMITVNSIILSAIISLLLRRLSEYEYLILPTSILLSVSLLAMTFSILATRPSIPNGLFSKEDVDNKNVNLLFFGNFYKMSLKDYEYGMKMVMEDREFLYGSLIRDVYAQGVVLGKKYRLLRIAYNIFMFGLIGSVVTFIIAAAFFGSTPASVK